jgi:hypothetical protein
LNGRLKERISGGDNIQIKEQARGKGKSGQGILIEKHYEQLVHSQL